MNTETKTEKRLSIVSFKSRGLVWFYVTKDGLRTHFYSRPDIARRAWKDGERIPTSMMNLGK